MKDAFRFLSSLRITVTCLALGLIVVFAGTLAQTSEGLWEAQQRWFKSFIVWYGPKPVFIGGYTIGLVLVINLTAAFIRKFVWRRDKIGIHMTHIGVLILLIGQLAMDASTVESHMRLKEGESKTFAEVSRNLELAFVSDASTDREQVVAVDDTALAQTGTTVNPPMLNAQFKIKEFGANCEIRPWAPMMDKGSPPATHGTGAKAHLTPLPEAKDMDAVNTPYVIMEVSEGGKDMGTWLFSPMLREQEMQLGGKNWRVSYRGERRYLGGADRPFSVKLLKTTHEVYRGTDIPKNFQSRVEVTNPKNGDKREVEIYMNNPLRYGGYTFYQFQMGRDELNTSRGTSTFQVVRNPSWVAPYVGCVVVTLGMCIQFLVRLSSYASKRKKLL